MHLFTFHSALKTAVVIRGTLGAALGSVNAREDEYVRKVNHQTSISGVCIILVPLISVVLLFVLSQPLRRAPKRFMLIDVAMTLLPLLGFQYLFFLFGKRWNYTTDIEHVVNVANVYDPKGKYRQALLAEAPELLAPDADITIPIKKILRSTVGALAGEQIRRIDPAIVRVAVQSLLSTPLVSAIPTADLKDFVQGITRGTVKWDALKELSIANIADIVAAIVALLSLNESDITIVSFLLLGITPKGDTRSVKNAVQAIKQLRSSGLTLLPDIGLDVVKKSICAQKLFQLDDAALDRMLT